MAYYREICKTGNVIEVRKTISYVESAKGKKRAKKLHPTLKAVAKNNERSAERTLRRRINTNFGPDDLHITLTYKDEPPDPEAAKKEIEKFLRRLRREFRKQGRELKYIWVTEYQKKKIHHHLIINRIDYAIVRKLWEYGRIRFVPLENDGQYDKLASYLIKETSKTFKTEKGAGGKRWNQSRNLKPYDELKREKIRAKEWRKEPVPFKGYMLEKDKVINFQWTIDGQYFETQEYSMVRIPELDIGRKKKCRKRQTRNGPSPG